MITTIPAGSSHKRGTIYSASRESRILFPFITKPDAMFLAIVVIVLALFIILVVMPWSIYSILKPDDSPEAELAELKRRKKARDRDAEIAKLKRELGDL